MIIVGATLLIRAEHYIPPTADVSAINAELDKTIFRMQQLDRDLLGCLKNTCQGTEASNTELPPVEARSGEMALLGTSTGPAGLRRRPGCWRRHDGHVPQNLPQPVRRCRQGLRPDQPGHHPGPRHQRFSAADEPDFRWRLYFDRGRDEPAGDGRHAKSAGQNLRRHRRLTSRRPGRNLGHHGRRCPEKPRPAAGGGLGEQIGNGQAVNASSGCSYGDLVWP